MTFKEMRDKIERKLSPVRYVNGKPWNGMFRKFDPDEDIDSVFSGDLGINDKPYVEVVNDLTIEFKIIE